MRILVTGAEGFIGKRLCELLDERKANFAKFSGDIRKRETFPKGDFGVILHLAAKIPHKGDVSEEELYEANVLGTRNIKEHYRGAKIVFISTTDVTRTDLTAYAKTKLEAEEAVKETEGNVIIRLPSVFGPNQVQDKLISRLIRHYYGGERCDITNNDLREYIFIDDACRGILEHMDDVGLLTLQGIKIKNMRLDALIKSIREKRELPDINAEETKLREQLKICADMYKDKINA